MKPFLIPAEETRTEITVVNSRFVATLSPAFNVDDAKKFVTKIKSEFRDASHNVSAFVIGHGQSIITHCSDNGEPSGTAGRPVLAVLQGSGLGDVVVVVTRYFGGTKLGKGGLVRSYGDAVRSVLKLTPLAQKVPTHTVMMALPYSHYDRVRNLIKTSQGKIIDTDFGVGVLITCRFTINDYLKFQTTLDHMTHGTLMPEIIETNNATIMPLCSQAPKLITKASK
jgi:uncharacterized YigZ family protein